MTKEIVLRETSAAYAPATAPTVDSIVDEVRKTHEPLLLVQDEKPVAAVIPISDYQRFALWRENELRHKGVSEKPESVPVDSSELVRRRAYRKSFEQERAAFYRLKPQLLETHRDQYVAVHGSQVVDSDTDDAELAKRVMAKYTHRAVYIQLVSEELPAFELPSPEEFTRA